MTHNSKQTFDETIHEFFENSGPIELAVDFRGDNGQMIKIEGGLETVEVFHELVEHGAILTGVRKETLGGVTVESTEVGSLRLEDLLHESIQLAAELYIEGGDNSEW